MQCSHRHLCVHISLCARLLSYWKDEKEWKRQGDNEWNGNNISDSRSSAHVKYILKWVNEWTAMYKRLATVNRPSMTKHLNFIQPVCCNAHNIHTYIHAYTYWLYLMMCTLCAMVLNYLIFSWCFHFISFVVAVLFGRYFSLNSSLLVATLSISIQVEYNF